MSGMSVMRELVIDTFSVNQVNCADRKWIWRRVELVQHSGAPNDRFLGNICSEPSRMPRIFESPGTAKNFENVSWGLFVWLRVSFGICVVCSPKNFGFCSNLSVL